MTTNPDINAMTIGEVGVKLRAVARHLDELAASFDRGEPFAAPDLDQIQESLNLFFVLATGGGPYLAVAELPPDLARKLDHGSVIFSNLADRADRLLVMHHAVVNLEAIVAREQEEREATS